MVHGSLGNGEVMLWHSLVLKRKPEVGGSELQPKKARMVSTIRMHIARTTVDLFVTLTVPSNCRSASGSFYTTTYHLIHLQSSPSYECRQDELVSAAASACEHIQETHLVPALLLDNDQHHPAGPLHLDSRGIQAIYGHACAASMEVI